MDTITAQNLAEPTELLVPDSDVVSEATVGARVILFNDEEHTFDEVIRQIVKATQCSLSQAEMLTLEVHFRGKARVFQGPVADCIRVSAVLEEIALSTQVEF
ncbi:MAG: hypothetical protein RLZZ273_1428 [Bacteroidota bacterium]|jgi:ATP-dependent Clp protease adapter protein ClpS